MKPRFRPREAFLLYAILLACVAVLFMVGLELGRDRMLAEATTPDRAAAESEDAPRAGQGPVEVFGNLSSTEGTTQPDEAAILSTEPDEAASSSTEPDEAATLSTERETAAREPDAATGTSVTRETPTAKPVEPAGSPSREAEEPGGADYTIQVAAHSSREEAQQTLIRLEAKGFEARIQPPTAQLGDHYYRVWVGEFDSIEHARTRETELKAAGFLTYIRKTR